MSMDMMRFSRLHMAGNPLPNTDFIQTSKAQVSLAKQQYTAKKSLNISASDFHAVKRSNPFKLLTGLVKWLKASINQKWSQELSDSDANEIASNLLKTCTEPGDTCLVNFQNGAHAALLVKTNTGYAFLSFGNGSDKCADEKVEDESKVLTEEKPDESRTRKQLLAEIKKYKDKKLNSKNCFKLGNMQTTKMIDAYNKFKSRGGYQFAGRNCSHAVMEVLEQGKHPSVEIAPSQAKEAVYSPSDTVQYAKKLSKENKKLEERKLLEESREEEKNRTLKRKDIEAHASQQTTFTFNGQPFNRFKVRNLQTTR